MSVITIPIANTPHIMIPTITTTTNAPRATPALVYTSLTNAPELLVRDVVLLPPALPATLEVLDVSSGDGDDGGAVGVGP